MLRYSINFLLVLASVLLLVGNTYSRQFENENRRESNSQYAQTRQSPPRPPLQRPSSSPSSVACPERNGRFPIASQCDAYVECIDGEGEEKLCPEGLLFNTNARFNYPCGYPIDVDCAGRPNLQPAQPSDDCPHQYGYFKVGDERNCGQFMNCADGTGYVFDCPEGLAFNAESYRCDWPDQVPDCDAEAFLGFTCPPVDNNSIYFGGETRFFRSPADCQHYFVCVESRPRLYNCGEGNAFNDLINTCDAAENVTGCEPPFQPEDEAGPAVVEAARRPKLF